MPAGPNKWLSMVEEPELAGVSGTRTYNACKEWRRIMQMLYPRLNPGALRPGQVTPGAVRPARNCSAFCSSKCATGTAGIAAGANRNTLRGVAKTARRRDISSKSQGIPAVHTASRWIATEPLALEVSQAGKFSRAVELFYLEFVRQFIEKKDVRIGLGLALRKSVGEANRGSL